MLKNYSKKIYNSLKIQNIYENLTDMKIYLERLQIDAKNKAKLYALHQFCLVLALFKYFYSFFVFSIVNAF